MTKVFLIHPVLGSSNSHTLVYRKGYGTAIPLGLAYIGAELLRNNHDVKIYDLQIMTADISQEIRKYKPDVLGISVCTPAANIARKLAEELKEQFPEIPIIAGGPHITTLKQAIFDETDVYDFLVIGEGEKTTVELIDEMFGAQNYFGVHGLCFKKNENIIQTEPRNFIQNLDELPYLPLHLFDYEKYIPTPGTFIYLPNVAFLSSRGCPFHCVFCNKSIFGNTLRQMSAYRMIDEIVDLKERYHIREFNFFDDTFTIDKHRVYDFCNRLIQEKIEIKWKCNSRVDTVTKDMLFLMKQAGCFSISFGVESGDDGVLKKIEKGITTAQAKDTFKWSKEAGIYRSAFFMLNLPGDTRASIEKTIKFSLEIDPDYVSFELTKPLPGTRIRNALMDEKNVAIKERLWNNWESCTISNKVFFTQNDLTEDYLIDAFNRAVKRFYLSIPFILKSVLRIRTYAQFKSYVGAAINIISAKALK